MRIVSFYVCACGEVSSFSTSTSIPYLIERERILSGTFPKMSALCVTLLSSRGSILYAPSSLTSLKEEEAVADVVIAAKVAAEEVYH